MKTCKIVSLLVIASICTSCSSKLSSTDEIMRYAQKEYGKSELVRVENTEEKTRCYLKDTRYGFEYWVDSRVENFSFDGTTFFKYEDKASSFDDEYSKFIEDNIKDNLEELKNEYDIETYRYKLLNVKEHGVINVVFKKDNLDGKLKILKTIGDLYKGIDTREYFKDTFIVVHEDTDYIGKYYLSTDKFVTIEEEDIDKFTSMATRQNRDAQFSHKEQIEKAEFLEMTGLSEYEIDSKINSEADEEGMVTLYYFSLPNGNEFYISDVTVHGINYTDYNQQGDIKLNVRV